MIMNVKNIKDPNFLENLEKFGKVLENDRLHELKATDNKCVVNIELCEVSLIAGRKYIKTLVGNSTTFFIDKINGDVYGMKDSKTINKKHYYGNIFNCEDKWWGFYCNSNKKYQRDMQNLLNVELVIKEFEKEQQQKEENKPTEKTNNSNCVVKFVNDKIIVQFNDSILNQDQAKLQLLAHNGFTYDYDNKIFVADNNDFMKNLLIKLGFLEGELIKVRKTRKEPFQIKEKASNKIVEKNNSENKPVDQKDDNKNSKNIIFVDFKNKKSNDKSVAPESIKKEVIEVFDDHYLTIKKVEVNNKSNDKLVIEFINNNNEVTCCNNWETATKIYNKLITFTMLSEKELSLKLTIKKYGEELKQNIKINKDMDFVYNFKNILIKNITKNKKELFNSNKLNVSEVLEKNKIFEHEYNLLSCF